MAYRDKTLDVIALLCLGHLYTARDIATHCDVGDAFVLDTLRGLEKRGLVRFVGWAPRVKGRPGLLPATWRWV